MLHEVVTSKVFKEAYTDMMVNGGGRWAKLGSQIEQDNHTPVGSFSRGATWRLLILHP